MKVILKHGYVRYEGVRYSAGDELEITEYYYQGNKTRYEIVEDKQVITEKVAIKNIKPEKVENEPKETEAKKAPARKKSAPKKAE